MADTSLTTALGDKVIAEAGRPEVAAHLALHGAPPQQLAARLRDAHARALADAPDELLRLYDALPPAIADWLSGDALGATARARLQEVLEANREAFAVLAKL